MKAESRNRATGWVPPVVLGIVFVAGCVSPEPKYETPVEEDPVCVTVEDLGVSPGAITGNGRKILDSQPSVGRFPSGVSVVRVAAMMEETGSRRYLRVSEMTTESAVYWMHLWDDLPPVREVTTLRTLGLDPRGASYADLLRESVNVDCDLCVIYAKVDDTDADAEFIGALWDAANHQALATFRAPAALPEEMREARAKSNDEGRWVSEAEFRAETDLRRLARDAMWDLVGKDQASPTTQPSPWQEYLPVFPFDYDRFQSIERVERLLDRKKD
ncbi:MAG: hypothetical protein JXQ75_04790 [Phycisphaerae bacterium]|nr:hypothetical protein [Phycisphaerae bacterium]